jgi:hypothetical protein
MERMPDSMIDIDIYVEDEKLFFRRFFCAFGPCLEGFQKGFRPYLSVDSTTLNGRWNGHLPSATCHTSRRGRLEKSSQERYFRPL